MKIQIDYLLRIIEYFIVKVFDDRISKYSKFWSSNVSHVNAISHCDWVGRKKLIQYLNFQNSAKVFICNLVESVKKWRTSSKLIKVSASFARSHVNPANSIFCGSFSIMGCSVLCECSYLHGNVYFHCISASGGWKQPYNHVTSTK